jgi:hypothetical protein
MQQRAVVVICAVAIAFGCDRTRDAAPADRTVPQAKAVTAGIDAAIKAWDGGSSDDAVERLTAAAESGILVGSKLPVFMLSETDVANMSRAQRNEFVTDLIKRVESLKLLGQSCLAAGDVLRSEGDADGARDYYNAVAVLGAELKSPQRVKGLHSLGAYFAGEATQRLRGLELESGRESDK